MSFWRRGHTYRRCARRFATSGSTPPHGWPHCTRLTRPFAAELAEALAESGHFSRAVSEADQALALDRNTPHENKKLLKEVRMRVEKDRALWEVLETIWNR